MKKTVMLLLIFISTTVSAGNKFLGDDTLFERMQGVVEIYNLTYDTHITMESDPGATLARYASAILKNEYATNGGCFDMLVGCQRWKIALRVLVTENKVAMRDYYLGCKLAYHAVTQTSVVKEVPDDVLVACYGDAPITPKTKLHFARWLFID